MRSMVEGARRAKQKTLRVENDQLHSATRSEVGFQNRPERAIASPRNDSPGGVALE